MGNFNIQIRQFAISILFAGLLSGCHSSPDLPSYLKDYSEEYKEDPKMANLKWFTDA